MSGVLERRYRKLLRMLPKPYREARGEELISVLMDSADEGRRWPEIREAISLAALGIRVRAGAAAGFGRSGRSGEVMRLVALCGLLLISAQGFARATSTFGERNRMAGDPRWWDWVFLYSPGFWLIAFVALIVGARRLGRFLVVGLCLATAFLAVRSMIRVGDFPMALLAGTDLPWTLLMGFAVTVSFRRGAPPVPYRLRWLASLVLLALLAESREMLHAPQVISETAPVIAGMLAIGVLIAASIQGWRSPTWPLALAICGLPLVFDIGLLKLAYREGFAVGPRAELVLGYEVALIAVAALALVKERLASRSTRTATPG